MSGATTDLYQARPGHIQIERPKLYAIARWEGGPRDIVEAVYVNNGAHAACIVATVDYAHGQWAAYMSGVDGGLTEDEAMRYTAEHGIKLLKEQGVRFFPMLPADAWRV